VNKKQGKPAALLTLEDMTRIAKEIALTHDGHVGMIFAQGSGRSIVGELREFSQTHEGKVRQMLLVGIALAQKGKVGTLEQAFLVARAWMSTARKGKLPRARPSQDPNRKEVLIITGFKVAQGQTHMAVLDMIRDARGRLTELTGFERSKDGVDCVENPLLTAFVQGFRLGIKRKIN
jgi:hypothetical protein